MTEKADRKPTQPMSLKLPEDLRAELQDVSAVLGETEATVARMSMSSTLPNPEKMPVLIHIRLT